MKRDRIFYKIVAIVIMFSFLSCFYGESIYAKKNFQDVPQSSSYFEAINFYNEQHFFDYKTGNRFNLNAKVSKGEAVKLLHQVASSSLKKKRTYNNHFKDVNNKTPFAKEIIWVYEVGLLNANAKQQLLPNSAITRAEAAQLVVDSLQLKSKGNVTVKDVSQKDAAYKSISILLGNEVTALTKDGTFLPNQAITAGQFVSFVYVAQMKTSAQTTTNGSLNETMERFATEYSFSWELVGRNKQLELRGVKGKQTVAHYYTVKGKSFAGASKIQVGISRKEHVTAAYGEPVTAIKKGTVNYNVNNKKNEFGIYLINDYYVTFFYDVHKKGIVRSILAVHKNEEIGKEGFHGSEKTVKTRQEPFEDLLVELMNQARDAEGLTPLIYTPKWKPIARAHSKDMIVNNFFDHNNRRGETPMQRAIKGGMSQATIRSFGENIAYGHYNAIYTHEALMNSKGHRDNILRSTYSHTFVGAEFKGASPFFTVNFYSLK